MRPVRYCNVSEVVHVNAYRIPRLRNTHIVDFTFPNRCNVLEDAVYKLEKMQVSPYAIHVTTHVDARGETKNRVICYVAS